MLDIRHLSHNYGSHWALKDCSFTLEKGDPVELSVRGDGVVVGPEAPVSVELHGQGGRLQSLQGSHPLIGGRRPDGSVIQAVVPESHPQEIVVDEG